MWLLPCGFLYLFLSLVSWPVLSHLKGWISFIIIINWSWGVKTKVISLEYYSFLFLFFAYSEPQRSANNAAMPAVESEETDASDSSEDSLWTEDEAEAEDASCLSGVEHGKEEEEEKEDEYWKFVQISHEHRTQLKSSKTRAARGKSS